MRIQAPCIITPSLKAGFECGGAYVSIDYAGERDGRTVYEWEVVLPDGTEYSDTDLYSGVGGGSLQDGLRSLCSFLTAAAESYDYRQRTGRDGESEDLFPPAIVEWAADNADELAMMGCELEETPGIIAE